jgi:outer membrane receptor for ferrienterochelin and colicin
MQKKGLLLFLISIFISLSLGVASQTDSTKKSTDTLDYYDMSLEQLMKMKAHGVPSELEKLINSLIAVASKKPLSIRESPSIISLITEEEIAKSGARDLIDVLRLVPGLDFGVDVEGVVGLGMRGNWAHEGKILLLIDGQEMNEILFATTQFGNHYPVEQIKKIEVIRGPGSAIYGGFAEYGVINIITKQGKDLNGVSVTGTYGQTQKDFARRNVNLSVGKKIGEFEYSFLGKIGQSQRSDQTYTDFSDSSYSMAGNSNLNPIFLNASMRYKGLSFRYIGDFFQTTQRDGYGDVVKGGAVRENFSSVYSELKYVKKFNEKLSMTARGNLKQQTPWQTDAYAGTDAYYRTATRLTGHLSFLYNVNRNINFVAGTETYKDNAIDRTDSSYFSNGQQQVSYHNYAFFVQGLVKTRFVNVILGARYDKHSAYGHAFVPRVGITKKYERFHFKALYSSAFRAPSIENIDDKTDAGIKPELTQVAELELGYQITHKSILTINFFDINTNNPIVYFTDSTNSDYYINSGKSGTQGIEAEYRIKSKLGYLSINYSYYTAANKQKIADYEVADDKSSLLAFANHKVNISGSWNITDELSLNPSASLYGPRWGYASMDSTGTSELSKFDPVFLVNLFVWYKTPAKGLNVGVGCYDMLNQRFNFIQPYNGYHAPLPAMGREFVFRLQYTLNFKPAKIK